MARIEVRAPGLGAAESHDVPDGHAVVLGRHPGPPGADGGAPAPITIASQSVSSRHLVVEAAGTAVSLRDLHSRNGTWLRLPPDDVVQVHSSQPLQLHLGAAPAAAAGAVSEPADAEWLGRADFAAGVCRAVTRWTEQQGAALAVTLLPSRSPRDLGGYAGHLQLADGNVLGVQSRRTLDDAAQGTFSTLWRYIARQNTSFTAEEESRAEGLILASPAIRQAHRSVHDAAVRGARALLLLGPSGSGKEGLAHCFHRRTGRGGPFVARNCSLFSKELLRSELFGAEPGAFTGAVKRIVGAVERAHTGTLFLDEIGEIGQEVQPMLLRFLDTGEYEAMGRYGQPLTADVRVVAATNRDLRAAARSGQFRADLWYRLSVQVVEVPPLRERPEDIEAFLRLRSLPSGVPVWEALTADARELVLANAWEGNFRELMNFVEQLPLHLEAIDAATCRQVLRRVAIADPTSPEPAPIAPPAVPPGVVAERWSRLMATALRAYREDLGKPAPETWDDVKLFLEKFLKPLVFADLGGVTGSEDLQRGLIANLTRQLETDRNTCAKQLARYQERFAPEG